MFPDCEDESLMEQSIGDVAPRRGIHQYTL